MAVPAAWGNADDPITAAHELGHVLGFDHWGCEHQGDEECATYPVAHGALGGVGVDIQHFRTIPIDSDGHAHDFMVTFVGGARNG